MTNDELQEHIRAIRAAVDSRQVQVRFEKEGKWTGAAAVHPCAYVEYRIKPKPREFLLAPIGTGPKDARHYADVSNITGNFEGTEYIRVREIVDE